MVELKSPFFPANSDFWGKDFIVDLNENDCKCKTQENDRESMENERFTESSQNTIEAGKILTRLRS
jgi:hypothetical protein